MTRKALIIAMIISAIYLFFGQIFIWSDVLPVLQDIAQPDWSLPPSTLIAAQIAIYFTFGFLIYRLMMAHQLMITPSVLMLLVTFFMWEVFKYSLFDLQQVFVTFIVLLIFVVLMALNTLFLFREDGRAGLAALPIVLFAVLYLTPWYYAVMDLSLQATGQG
jgi:hypothetical protein